MEKKSSNKIILIVLITIIVVGLTPTTLKSAEPLPCDTNSFGYFYLSDSLQRPPVLFTYMPLDVLVGYIGADSIFANVKRNPLNTMIRGLNADNDTFKYALKYLYRMCDYNPTHFHNFEYGFVRGAGSSGSEVHRELAKIVKRQLDANISGGIYSKIINCDYILHVFVNDTEKIEQTDTFSVFSDEIVCYAKVLDSIKGQNMPSTTNIYSSTGKVVANTDIVFQYNLNQENRQGRIWDTITETYKNYGYYPPWREDGTDWIQPTNEYIVFLNIGKACEVNNNFYYYFLYPKEEDVSMGMFPIIDGNVIDIGNTFGLGTSIPLVNFKEYLSQKISQIKNFGE
jgi:hypothetical protein